MRPEKSREEVLAEAVAEAEKARLLARTYMDALEAINQAYPPPYGTKSKMQKHREAKFAVERLNKVLARPRELKYFWDNQDRRQKELAEAEAKKLAALEKDKEKLKLVDEAIAWLLANTDQKFGTDFTSEDAIAVADDVAYEREIAKMTADGGLHSFGGDDNCEGCGGWDGVSHRCECGNRRVSWTQGWGHSFKSPEIYAEAN